MSKKFRRTEPAERRDLLIEAALRCLYKDGREGLSVRNIAAEANVSVGLVIHHFGSVDVLVSHAYNTLAQQNLRILQQALNKACNSPAERLDAFLAEWFRPQMLDPDLLRAWLVFWSMQRQSQAIAQTHSEVYTAYLGILESLLSDVSRDEGLAVKTTRLAAIGLSATLDGLWLELSLNPSTFTPDEALEICKRWTRSFRRGDYD